MKITKHETLIYFDVDKTLVRPVSPSADNVMEIDYYGMIMYVHPIRKHIELLKAYKARGAYIIVHTGNGWQWAVNVVKALGLEKYVDECKTKGAKYVDDQHYDSFTQRIYLGETDEH